MQKLKQWRRCFSLPFRDEKEKFCSTSSLRQTLSWNGVTLRSTYLACLVSWIQSEKLKIWTHRYCFYFGYHYGLILLNKRHLRIAWVCIYKDMYTKATKMFYCTRHLSWESWNSDCGRNLSDVRWQMNCRGWLITLTRLNTRISINWVYLDIKLVYQ